MTRSLSLIAKNIHYCFLSFIIACLCICTNTYAEWKDITPHGGRVGAIAIDPVNIKTIYAVGNDGIYKSINSGSSWSLVNDDVDGVSSIVVDSLAPSIVYAGTRGGVIKSTNGGVTWAPYSSGIETSISALAMDANSTPRAIYALAGGDLYRSINGGNSWTNLSVLDYFTITSLCVDKDNPGTIYVGTANEYLQGSSGGVLKSTDGGATWDILCTQLASMNDDQISSIVVDSTTSSIYCAITHESYSRGVYKSKDGGKSWFALKSAIKDIRVSELILNPKKPRTIYAKTYKGIFKSTDGGNIWSPMNSGLTDLQINGLALSPLNPQIIYAGTSYDGLFRSTDGAVSWVPRNSGLGKVSVYSLAIDPLNSQIIYAGTYGHGVLKSVNGGLTWTSKNDGITNFRDVINCIAINPMEKPHIVYIGNSSGLLMSTNGGRTWVVASYDMMDINILSIIIDPRHPKVLYAATEYGIFKSNDGGKNWQKSGSGITADAPISCLAISKKKTNILYAATGSIDYHNGVLYKSIDGGVNWIAVEGYNYHDEVTAVVIHPANPNIVYAASYDYAYNDWGQLVPHSWNLVKSIDGFLSDDTVLWGDDGDYVSRIFINPWNPRIVYTESLKSTDGGISWNKTPGLSWIDDLIFDPQNDSIIYAVTGRLMKSTDGDSSYSHTD